MENIFWSTVHRLKKRGYNEKLAIKMATEKIKNKQEEKQNENRTNN